MNLGAALTPALAAIRPVLPLVGTLLAYEAGLRLQRLFKGNALANPVLIAVILTTAALEWSDDSASDYAAGVQPLAMLLGPATVALALPVYRCMPRIRETLMPILASVAVGAVTAAVAATVVASSLGVPDLVVRSMATKSATAAIAMAVAPQIGGDASLAAGLSVLTGILGAVTCAWVLDRAGVRDPRARGLATGVAAHGIGTARMLALDTEAGAFSGLAMGLTGLATGIVLPFAYLWLAGHPG